MAKKLSNTQKKKIRDITDRAMHAYQAGRYDMCERLCKQAEAMQPDNADVAFMRGAMLLSMYGVEQSLPYMQLAAERAPKRIDFQVNLGTLYLQNLQHALALECFSAAEKLNASSMLVQLGCCLALTGLNRYVEARVYLERARSRKPEKPQEWMQLAIASRELGEMQAAMGTLDELIENFPGFAQGMYAKAQTAMQMGDVDAAREATRLTLKIDPYHAQALKMLAETEKFESDQDERIDLIRNALDSCPDGTQDRVFMLNAMAEAMRKLGNHAESFAYYRQANELRSKLREYDACEALQEMDRIMQAFTPAASRSTVPEADTIPIFVIGMPRCGSTLVEQILLAHSQASGRGEIDALASVMRETSNCKGDMDIAQLASLSDEQCEAAGHEYIRRLKESGEDTRYIVDKSLNNILYVGLIHRILPHARIVHVRRHPLDTCLSIYTSNIQGSLFDYGLRLDSLGAYYRKYLELMSHWRRVLPAGGMYELEYEQLVADQEGETRKLLAACGLNWEDACLEFQKARQRVNTASIMQVRQSMYNSSVARWKRYEDQIKPLIDILGTEYPPRD